MLGLIELLFVLLIALGWAVFELRGLSKDRGKATPPPNRPPPDPPA